MSFAILLVFFTFYWLDIILVFASFLASSLPASILIKFHFSITVLPMFIFYSFQILRQSWIQVRSQLCSDQDWIKVLIRSIFRYLVTLEHSSIIQIVAFCQLKKLYSRVYVNCSHSVRFLPSTYDCSPIVWGFNGGFLLWSCVGYILCAFSANKD